ncbi:hypothetical protein AGDE_04862 [Angomonas deanei]|uniref:Uncharacterized protein n=1 Tax=Angomonas deanei TaxID=59799 RepID=A0A7G2BZK5_9TRYP|nr:hypothetical protein AGDE_04862 [Angomonas deanei]CAD2212715.1 hypothetical protein, conserved [Angomonas deanei]|eukprot:EPY39067.1 hypothetical protein AGDE_04862 [Angomonas deanei]
MEATFASSPQRASVSSTRYTTIFPASYFPPPEPAPGRLLLCGYTGAVLFRSKRREAVTVDKKTGLVPIESGLEEWMEYRNSSAPGGTSTVMSEEQADVCLREGMFAIGRFFEHVWHTTNGNTDEATQLFSKILSKKYTPAFTSIFSEIVTEVKASSPSIPCFCELKTSLTKDHLMEYGRYFSQSNDAVLDLQRVPDLLSPHFASPSNPVSQITVLGIPFALFDEVFPRTVPAGTPTLKCCPKCEDRRRLAYRNITNAGLVVKSQPNSVCIHREAVDKSNCVSWMLRNAEECDHFSLEKSLAFGDVPATVDRHLAMFPPMKFVSVSPKADDGLTATDEIRGNVVHVGGEEEGTALFLDAFLRSCESKGAEGSFTNWFTPEHVEQCIRHIE